MFDVFRWLMLDSMAPSSRAFTSLPCNTELSSVWLYGDMSLWMFRSSSCGGTYQFRLWTSGPRSSYPRAPTATIGTCTGTRKLGVFLVTTHTIEYLVYHMLMDVVHSRSRCSSRKSTSTP